MVSKNLKLSTEAKEIAQLSKYLPYKKKGPEFKSSTHAKKKYTN